MGLEVVSSVVVSTASVGKLVVFVGAAAGGGGIFWVLRIDLWFFG